MIEARKLEFHLGEWQQMGRLRPEIAVFLKETTKKGLLRPNIAIAYLGKMAKHGLFEANTAISPWLASFLGKTANNGLFSAVYTRTNVGKWGFEDTGNPRHMGKLAFPDRHRPTNTGAKPCWPQNAQLSWFFLGFPQQPWIHESGNQIYHSRICSHMRGAQLL